MTMNSHSPQVTAGPAGPSPVVRIVMRPMTRLLNPLIGRFAGRRHFPMAARLQHTGRRSGRTYRTSVGARVAGDTAIIPLTFGTQSDWARNVLAAGGCLIRVDGQDYRATTPEFLDERAAFPVLGTFFGPVSRAGFRLLGIRQYLRLTVVAAGRTS